jgi:hypothetical protein
MAGATQDQIEKINSPPIVVARGRRGKLDSKVIRGDSHESKPALR